MLHVLAERSRSLRWLVTLPQSVHPAPRLGPSNQCQAWLRRQISAGGTHRAGSPDLTEPSSLRERGTQRPASPQAPQVAEIGGQSGPTVCDSCRWLLPLGRRDRRRSLPPQGLGPASGWPWPGLWNLPGHSPQPVPWATGTPSSPTGWWTGELTAPSKGRDPPLASVSTCRTPLLDCWPTNGHSEGPSAVLING